MGKITGFLEYEREAPHKEAVQSRLKHWHEFEEKLPEEKLRVFRNLMRSLTHDAVKAVTELEMGCGSIEQLQGCRLVQHYLSYMKRLCEGRV